MNYSDGHLQMLIVSSSVHGEARFFYPSPHYIASKCLNWASDVSPDLLHQKFEIRAQWLHNQGKIFHSPGLPTIVIFTRPNLLRRVTFCRFCALSTRLS